MRRFGPPGECEKGVWLNEGMGGMSKKKALPLVSAGLVLPRHCGVCVCVCVSRCGRDAFGLILPSARAIADPRLLPQDVHTATVIEVLQSIRQSEMSPILSRIYQSEGGPEVLDTLMKYLYVLICFGDRHMQHLPCGHAARLP